MRDGLLGAGWLPFDLDGLTAVMDQIRPQQQHVVPDDLTAVMDQIWWQQLQVLQRQQLLTAVMDQIRQQQQQQQQQVGADDLMAAMDQIRQQQQQLQQRQQQLTAAMDQIQQQQQQVAADEEGRGSSADGGRYAAALHELEKYCEEYGAELINESTVDKK